MTSSTVSLAADLIRKESTTPSDAGCQQLIADRLGALGFNCRDLRFGDVDNLWATHAAADSAQQAGPLFVFAGHTDVVPTGDVDSWVHAPFSALIEDGMLHGRGAADMKGSLAAMVTAVERFIPEHPDHAGCVAFLLTSDEEGPATDGTVRVIETLSREDTKIDYCIVGEPTSSSKLGDVIKNGRRGSLSAHMTVQGKQGHVAYPHLADNPIHKMSQLITLMVQEHWDDGNEFFPPTTFQLSNIKSGTGASNVIPHTAEAWFNFRFSTESTAESLKQRTMELIQSADAVVELDWNLSGQPFLTNPGVLTDHVAAAIEQVNGVKTELSTTGGTSDARFIAPTGTEVIELGPVNETIHKVDECISCDDLDKLSQIYEQVLVRFFASR